MSLQRLFFLNNEPVSKEVFLEKISDLTWQDIDELKFGETIIKNGNSFRIENWDGI